MIESPGCVTQRFWFWAIVNGRGQVPALTEFTANKDNLQIHIHIRLGVRNGEMKQTDNCAVGELAVLCIGWVREAWEG